MDESCLGRDPAQTRKVTRLRIFKLPIMALLVWLFSISVIAADLPPRLQAFLESDNLSEDWYFSGDEKLINEFIDYVKAHWEDLLESPDVVVPKNFQVYSIIAAAERLPDREYVRFLNRMCDLRASGKVSYDPFKSATMGHTPFKLHFLAHSYRDLEVRRLLYRFQKLVHRRDEARQAYFWTVLFGLSSFMGDMEPENARSVQASGWDILLFTVVVVAVILATFIGYRSAPNKTSRAKNRARVLASIAAGAALTVVAVTIIFSGYFFEIPFYAWPFAFPEAVYLAGPSALFYASVMTMTAMTSGKRYFGLKSAAMGCLLGSAVPLLFTFDPKFSLPEFVDYSFWFILPGAIAGGICSFWFVWYWGRRAKLSEGKMAGSSTGVS